MLRALKLCPIAFAFVMAACGDGENNVDVVVSEIDFGATDCGTTAIPRILTITNNTPNAFNFNVTTGRGDTSMYTVVPPNGAVLARSQVQVMIHSRTIPQESEVTENLYGDVLTVTTDMDGDMPHSVEIKQSARGAILTPSMETINFATPVPLGTTASMALVITNEGNAPAKFDALPSFFSVGFDGGGQEVAVGASVAGMVTFSPPANVAHTQTLTLAAEGPLCGSQRTIEVSGVGTAKGLAAHAVPAMHHGNTNNLGGTTTLCVRTTTGVVACGGHNINGMRGATDEFLELLGLPSGKGGKGGFGGGVAILDVVNVVLTKDGYLTDVTDLVAGSGFYCARTMAGDEWCWGDHRGIGRQTDPAMRLQPAAVKVATNVRAISAGYLTRCTVTEPNGTLGCRSGFAGDSNPGAQGWIDTNIASVDNAGTGAFARKTDGTVVTFGFNNSFERGTVSPPGAGGFVIPDFADVAQVANGGRGINRSNRFACARKTDSSVWCWGDNRHGQLGNGLQGTNLATPVQVIDTADVPIAATQITVGQAHVCGLTAAGVVCWGRGEEGQTGSGNLSQNVLKAEAVTPALSNVLNIEAAKTRTTCASLSTGALRCWGHFAGGEYAAPEPIFAFEP